MTKDIKKDTHKKAYQGTMLLDVMDSELLASALWSEPVQASDLKCKRGVVSSPAQAENNIEADLKRVVWDIEIINFLLLQV